MAGRLNRGLAIGLVFLMPLTAAAEDVVLLYEGKIYVLDLAKLTPAKVLRVESETPPTPQPPPTNPTDPATFKRWAAATAAAIPDHPLKEAASGGLAAGYSALAQAWRDGKIADADTLLAEVGNLQTELTTALGVRKQWEVFSDGLLRQLKTLDPDQIPLALEATSAGLTEGRAINPAVVQAAIELAIALAGRDRSVPLLQDAAVRAALFKLVVALLAGIG